MLYVICAIYHILLEFTSLTIEECVMLQITNYSKVRSCCTWLTGVIYYKICKTDGKNKHQGHPQYTFAMCDVWCACATTCAQFSHTVQRSAETKTIHTVHSELHIMQSGRYI